jgi:prepilin-type N-terminal cleavage/methylation domain-containing protein
MKKRSAFTLIELLVAMTILAMMVIGVTKIISDATRAVNAGYRQAFDDSNVRAIFDTVMDDMNQAIADDQHPMEVDTTPSSPAVPSTYEAPDFATHRLTFSSCLGPDPSCDASVRSTFKKVEYEVQKESKYYVLKRGERCLPPADDTGGNLMSYPLLDYVVSFQVQMFTTNAAVVDPSLTPDFGEIKDTTTRLPMYVTMSLATISDKIHQRAMSLPSTERISYIRRFAKRHFWMIQFPMRTGRIQELDYTNN